MHRSSSKVPVIQVRLLGSFDVRDGAGCPVTALLQQPRRAALLAYLAASPAGVLHRRDSIVALFWPESDEAHARNSLSAALRFLRKSLGESTIVGRGSEEVGLDTSEITSDVALFEAMAADGELRSALAIYRGDLLTGFHISGVPGFEDWLERERARLRHESVTIAVRLSELAMERGEDALTVHWLRLATERAPDDESMLQRLVAALDRSGDRVGALRAYEAFATRIKEEFDADPAPETQALVGRVRDRTEPSLLESTSPFMVNDAYHAVERRGSDSAQATLDSPFDLSHGSNAKDPTKAHPLQVAYPIHSRASRLLPRSLVVITIAGAVLASFVWNRDRLSGNNVLPSVTRLTIALPDSAPLAFVGSAVFGVGRTSLTISPDGARIAYTARVGANTLLYVRELDRLETTALSGTEGAYQPFFSPNGEWVGFFSGNELKKVSVRGGPVLSLAPAIEPFGASWAADDRILIADLLGYRLSWVPSGGGPAQPLRQQIASRVLHPELLPGDEWILHGTPSGFPTLSSLKTGQQYVFTVDGVQHRDSADFGEWLYGRHIRYVASGHITFVSGDGNLLAMPFDLDRLEIHGPPAPVLAGLRIEGLAGGAQYTVSRNGTLAYVRGSDSRLSHFVWVDHASGSLDTLPIPPGRYGGFDLSPDDSRILARADAPSGPPELWVLDVARGGRTRIAVQGFPSSPRWWPDGTQFVYTEVNPDPTSGGRITIRQSVNDPRARDTLLDIGAPVEPSRDGASIAVPNGDSWLIVPLNKPLGERQNPTLVEYAAFSPNGRWLAFTSLYRQQSDVFVVAVDQPDLRYKISVDGGEEAVWTPDGTQLVYRNGRKWMMVNVFTAGQLTTGRPRVLFEGPYLQVPGWSADISADGRKHLVLLGPPEESATELIVVTNWFDELSRAAPLRRP